jgi:Flp pilus assembly protein TadD
MNAESPTRARWIAAAIVAAGLVCYANAYTTPFVFDGTTYVVENRALQRLGPPFGWATFCPTRVVVYFTFALNYALGGESVVGYHVVNTAIHVAAALALFGCLRRTLQLPGIDAAYRLRADAVAGTIALLWVVHPLCTQSVTFLYQRLESMAALFALLGWYCFLRGAANTGPTKLRWLGAAIGCVYAALLSKESVAALPLLLILFDRLFLSRDWRGVARRAGFHAAACGAWLALFVLMVAAGDDNRRAGIGAGAGLSSWQYALNQSVVLLHYLRLAFVPVGLCFDYAWPAAAYPRSLVVPTAIVLAAVAITVYGVVRGRTWSFAPAAFFLLLAPSSSLVPIIDLAYEHRMYLPLAAVLTMFVGGIFAAAVCVRQRVAAVAAEQPFDASVRRAAAGALAVVVVLLVVLTVRRNEVYASEATLWNDVLVHAPHNPRAHVNLGIDCKRRRLYGEAEAHYRQALAYDPEHLGAHYNLGVLYFVERRYDLAEQHFVTADRLRPDDPATLTALGMLRGVQNRFDESIAYLQASLRLDPENPQTESRLRAVVQAAATAPVRAP